MTCIGIEETFPLFLQWPSEKVIFLEQNSRSDEEYQFEDSTVQEEETPPEREFVVVREEFVELLNCPLCGDRMLLVFDEREDEWVYEETKEYRNLPYHYPTCYDYVVQDGLKNDVPQDIDLHEK